MLGVTFVAVVFTFLETRLWPITDFPRGGSFVLLCFAIYFIYF